MAIPLRTRRDLKNAGHAMAVEAMEAFRLHMNSLSQAEMDDVEHVERLTRRMLGAADAVASEYRTAGIPEDWIRRFLLSFRRTVAAECQALSLTLRPVAGTA
ncbi:hypothetical protein FV232_06925 [Methylobacterium sp. WL30]|uniref:hypothetical protein n=1 Tax=unclassified Methylobacterium TaxID=2615210 RepID=UPI0011CA5D13|nr:MULTISPECIES: hypothetical protein [unclassified Methylobacterium]TXN40446.1 hypothetical protein FV225_06180 [Methylobacterium sp. WL93]TXN49155.1 hypothetical protein FV227_17905 [Methylobacterium sp. WL119]TXN68964.1 hypothetical protein FV232_06925 [Methylobacterium sp. WL30]